MLANYANKSALLILSDVYSTFMIMPSTIPWKVIINS